MKTIISCSGYFGTGSSAATDYLKEFNKIAHVGVSDYEIRFVKDPYGVAWLENTLINFPSTMSNEAIINLFLKKMKAWHEDTFWYRPIRFWYKPMYQKLFKGNFYKHSVDYINDIVEIKYPSHLTRYDIYLPTKFDVFKIFIFAILQKMKITNIEGGKMTRYECYIQKDEFYKKTKKYINNVFSDFSEKDYIVLDAFIPPYNIDRYLNYFDNLKVVIVDRDPRDLYVLNKKIWKSHLKDIKVEKFIEIFKNQRKDKMEKESSSVLRIRFEDCIYKYDTTMPQMLNDLSLSHLTHTDKKKYFNPDISIGNTQLFYLYKDLLEDIKLIEKELEQYCYDFPYKAHRDSIKQVF